MTIDHIGMYNQDIPIYFRWIGRLSAPIFMFCSIQSYIHTTNKLKYILRLYIASSIMRIIQIILLIENNFIHTICSTIIIIHLIELYFNNKHNKIFIMRFKQFLVALIVWHLFFYLVLLDDKYIYIASLSLIFLTLFPTEGGLLFISFGIGIYFATNSKNYSKNKINLIIFMLIHCFIYSIISLTPILSIFTGILGSILWGSLSWLRDFLEILLQIIDLNPMYLNRHPLLNNYQWMMIFSLPILINYNYKSGYPKNKLLKYFFIFCFYIYYPLHLIILLYYI